MTDRKLKKALQKTEVPPCDNRRLEAAVAGAKQAARPPQGLRMSSARFFWNQLTFIRKRTWLLKASFSALLLFLLFTGRISGGSRTWTLMAISGPVLCLAGADQISEIFQPGLLEIQMTARNSFRKVLLVRLTAFGVLDLAFFVCGALGMSVLQSVRVWQMVLYGTVPYLVMCFGCLLILNRSTEKHFMPYSGCWGICLCCAIMVLRISKIGFYEEAFLGGWAAVGILALGGTLVELRKLCENPQPRREEYGFAEE